MFEIHFFCKDLNDAKITLHDCHDCSNKIRVSNVVLAHLLNVLEDRSAVAIFDKIYELQGEICIKSNCAGQVADLALQRNVVSRHSEQAKEYFLLDTSSHQLDHTLSN